MEDITITEDNIGLIRDYMEHKALRVKDICKLSFRKIEKKCFDEGLILLNEALKYYPDELILWSNRSVCYCELGYYIEALKDGQEMAVRFPGKINSYFRMAEAYRGLRRYKDAVLCYEEVLKRDSTCASAAARLRELRSKNLGTQNADEATAMTAGAAGNAVPSPSEIGGDVYYSDEEDDEWKPCPVGPVGSRSGEQPTAAPARPYAEPASKQNMNVASNKSSEAVDTGPKTYSKVAATNCCPNSKLNARPNVARSKSPPDVRHPTNYLVTSHSGHFFYNVNNVDEKDPCTDPHNPLGATSIWIGNVFKNIDKDMLYPFFQKIGNVINIVVYHAQTCAFVNFENSRAAGRAMRELQGLTVNGVKLLLRYPDRFASKNVNKPRYVASSTDAISKRVGLFSNKKYHNGKH